MGQALHLQGHGSDVQVNELSVQTLCKSFELSELQCYLESGKHHRKDITRMLAKCAKPTSVYACCQFIIFYSRKHPQWEILLQKYCILTRILINKSHVDVMTRDVFGKTPLHYLVRAVHSPMAETLAKEMFNNGLDVNACDHRGRTALHLSGPYSWDDFLIKHGACINIRQVRSQVLPIQKAFDQRHNYQLAITHLKAGLNLSYLPSAIIDDILDSAIQDNHAHTLLLWIEAGGKVSGMSNQRLEELGQSTGLNFCELGVLMLKRMAANVIRVNLCPNAQLGVQCLDIPTLLKDFITLTRL